MIFFEDDAAKSFSKTLSRLDSISVVTSISIRLFSGNLPSPETFRLMICSLALFKTRISSKPEAALTVRSSGTVKVAVIFLSLDTAAAFTVDSEVSALEAIAALFVDVSFAVVAVDVSFAAIGVSAAVFAAAGVSTAELLAATSSLDATALADASVGDVAVRAATSEVVGFVTSSALATPPIKKKAAITALAKP